MEKTTVSFVAQKLIALGLTLRQASINIRENAIGMEDALREYYRK